MELYKQEVVKIIESEMAKIDYRIGEKYRGYVINWEIFNRILKRIIHKVDKLQTIEKGK